MNGNLNGNKKKRRKKIIIGSIIGVLVLADCGRADRGDSWRHQDRSFKAGQSGKG